MNEVINDIKVLGFWRYLYARFLYRAIMKLAHRYNWHYAPEIGPLEPGGETQLWCKWCGFRMTKPKSSGAKILSGSGGPESSDE